MEPRRIMDGDLDPSRRRLLGSAVLDEPPAGEKERMFAAFGLGSGIALKPQDAMSSTAAPATGAGGIIVAKCFLVGALVGTAMAGGLAVTQRGLERKPLAASVAAPVVESKVRELRAPSVQRTLAPSTDLVIQPPAVRSEQQKRVPSRSPRMEPARRASAESAPSLGAEIASLSRAQRTLSSGDASSALRELDVHARAFPNPVLGPETLLVRIEALVSLGRGADAKQLGAAFLASNPTSAHAQRIRSLLNRSDLGPP